MKICQDCKWYDGYGLCKSPKVRNRLDLVNGGRRPVYMSCKVQREDSWLLSRLTGTCGFAGRFFEPICGESTP